MSESGLGCAVKTGKAHNEQNISGLPPIADIARRGWHGRKVPIGDITLSIDHLIEVVGGQCQHLRAELTDSFANLTRPRATMRLGLRPPPLYLRPLGP
jgi:hypothetical protein